MFSPDTASSTTYESQLDRTRTRRPDQRAIEHPRRRRRPLERGRGFALGQIKASAHEEPGRENIYGPFNSSSDKPRPHTTQARPHSTQPLPHQTQARPVKLSPAPLPPGLLIACERAAD